MRALPRPAIVYIVAVWALGGGLLLRELGQLPTASTLVGAVLLAALAAAADLRQLRLSYNATYSVATAVNFCAVILYGPGAAGLVAATGSIAGDLAKRKPWYKVVFNATAIPIAVIAGGAAFNALRQTAPGSVAPGDLPALGVFVGVHLLVNHALICTVIALATRTRLWDVVVTNYRDVFVPIVAVYPLGVLMAVTYLAFGGWIGLAFLAVPILAVYGALQRAQELREHTVAALETLADALDRRDPYTAEHSRRVADYCRRMALVLGLSTEEREILVEAARVHDLGKICVPDGILHKDGPLDDDEWQVMREHPQAGEAILEKLPVYRRHARLVASHHERIDGTGYPHRTSGAEIPFGARILAVADAFDAMTSDRPYRAGMPAAVAIERLRRSAGTQFSPEAVEALATALGFGEAEYASAASYADYARETGNAAVAAGLIRVAAGSAG